MVGESTKKQILRPRAERTEAHAQQPECENTRKRTSSSVTHLTHTRTHSATHTKHKPSSTISSGEKQQANVAVVGL